MIVACLIIPPRPSSSSSGLISRATCSSPAALLAVWIAAGLMTIAGARHTASGWDDAAGGRPGPPVRARWKAAFLFGWTLLLVIQTGTIAAVAVAWGFMFRARAWHSAPMPFAGLVLAEAVGRHVATNGTRC